MNRLAAIGAGLALGLVLASPAAGALEVRLSVSPGRPAAFEPTRVALRAYAPLIRADGSCCRLEPHAPRSYPFRVEAVSPAGRVYRVRVRWAAANLWRGVFAFPTPGRWTVRVANYGPSYRHLAGAIPRLTVIVRRAR